jgi:protein N-terminal methyltransferase
VSKETLLPLFEDVILLEPVDKFVQEAYRSGRDGEWRDLPVDGSVGNYGLERGKRVWFVKAGLQGCDPVFPARGGQSLGVVGTSAGGEAQEGFGGDGEISYDV